ncbi:hypothetical protein D0Z07_0291 [Hyphodiscus hymeniophilus]|uniref:Ethyl tert-butyl ether degradation EthD n=1 Tax=Hyphodiscus hymeniophilus TaxID=353542 RepID=A0A9P6VT01_9HELO|nr:hypothetical protein D0Z07_0291 [Hyphodiscus hymeniophilus]
MATTITLIYPAVDFDLKYYLNSHMPMVAKTWKNKGLTRWTVSEIDPSSGNSTQCILEFTSADAFQKAMAEDEAQIMGDIPNYTQGKPQIIIGKIVGTS